MSPAPGTFSMKQLVVADSAFTWLSPSAALEACSFSGKVDSDTMVRQQARCDPHSHS